MQQKIPFHYGLFYGAMCYWLRREPDQKSCLGYDGFYDFLYYPTDKKEADHFRDHLMSIREWLDQFEVIFSRTRVEFHRDAGFERDKLALRVMIAHPVPAKEPDKK